MNSKETPRSPPHKDEYAGEPPLEDQASTLSGVAPRVKGEFDPREGFYPQSLIPQIDALAEKEGGSPLMAPPLAAEPRRVRTAYWAIPLLLLGLFGAAYWYDRKGDEPSPPRASGSVGPGPATATAGAPPGASGPSSGSDTAGRSSPPSAPLPIPSASTNPAATAFAPASPAAPTNAAAPAPSPANTAAPVPPPTNAASTTTAAPAKTPPAATPSAPAVVRVQQPAPPRGNVARGAPPTSRAQPAPAPAPAAAPPAGAGYASGVTHTKGGANVEPAQPPRAAVPVPATTPPAAAGGASTACTDSLAALGLCTPNRTGR